MGCHGVGRARIDKFLNGVVENLIGVGGVFLAGALGDDLAGRTGVHDAVIIGRPVKVGIQRKQVEAHGQAGAAHHFAQHELDFRNCGAVSRFKSFGAVADDAAVLLRLAGKEPGRIGQRNHRNVVGIDQIHKPGELV